MFLGHAFCNDTLLVGVKVTSETAETFQQFFDVDTAIVVVVDEFLEAVNLVRYTEDFLRGVVDSRQLVVGFSVMLFFLYQTVVALGSRRWR